MSLTKSVCRAARAFGRRLSWNALVPFADCLNHSNVQVRYLLIGWRDLVCDAQALRFFFADEV